MDTGHGDSADEGLLAGQSPAPQEETVVDALLEKARGVEGCRNISVTLSCQENERQCTTYAQARWSAEVQASPNVPSSTPMPLQTPDAAFSFGLWLKSQRSARHLSQSELAQRMSITPSFLSRLERDERSPSREHLEMLASVLGLETQKVFLRAGVLPAELLNRIQHYPEEFLGLSSKGH